MAEAPRSTSSPQIAITHAEPITVFHLEVLNVNDSQVAKLTTQLLYVSFCLVIVAVVNFVIDLGRGSLSLSSAIMNLLVALSLPACGFIGVKDRNITCIQYFCCCTYLCAFLTFISMISAIVLLAGGEGKYASQLALFAVFFLVYLKGGGLSQRLQEQPYFTQDRLAPRNSFSVHQNTVECNPQPTAHAEFVESAPVFTDRAPTTSLSEPPSPTGSPPPGVEMMAAVTTISPHNVVVVGDGVASTGEATAGPRSTTMGSSRFGSWTAMTSSGSRHFSGDGAGAAPPSGTLSGEGGDGSGGDDEEEGGGGGVVPVATAVAVMPPPSSPSTPVSALRRPSVPMVANSVVAQPLSGP